MDDFFRHCKTVKPDIKQKYFNSQKGVVSALFNYAIMNGLMTVNYAEHYKVDEEHFQPATTHNDEERIFSSAEKEVIFGLAKSSNNVYDLGICLLFYTGLRIGELCAVKWEDVTESNGNFYLAVKRELVEDVKKGTRSGKIIVEHCKSKNGIRQVPLNSEAIQLLKEIKRMNVKLEFPVFSDDFIFLRRNNNTDFNITFCTDRTFDSRLRTLCKQANMKYIKSPHDIRRTYATNLHYCGIKLKTIQKWMGHSTLEQTMEYVHFDDTTENTECLCNKVQQIQPTIKKVATLDF
jgi:integrase